MQSLVHIYNVKNSVLVLNWGPAISKMWPKCNKNSQKSDKNVTKDYSWIIKIWLNFENPNCDKKLTKMFKNVAKNWQKTKMYLKCDKTRFQKVTKNWQNYRFCQFNVTFLFKEMFHLRENSEKKPCRVYVTIVTFLSHFCSYPETFKGCLEGQQRPSVY